MSLALLKSHSQSEGLNPNVSDTYLVSAVLLEIFLGNFMGKKIKIQSKLSKIGSNQISGGLNFQKVSKKTNIFWKFAQFEWEKSLILTGIYCLPYSSLRGVIWPTLIMYLELCCVP